MWSPKKDVLKIPNAALRFKPAERAKSAPSERVKGGSAEKGPGIWIIENEKPKRVSVDLGISDGSYTEIVSGNIHEGQDVIVESLLKQKQEAPRGPRMF
jgi:HlyD family secretion protein